MCTPRAVASAAMGLVICLLRAPATLGARPQDAAEVPELLLTRQLLEARGLHVGDTIRLSIDPAGAGARTFRIAGVYEPAPDPMRFAQPRFEARLHLPDLASLTADPSDPAA